MKEKYIGISPIIEAEKYQLGMEDGLGCKGQRCLSHNSSDCIGCGWKIHPFIYVKSQRTNWEKRREYIKPGDYIVYTNKYDDEERDICEKEIFESLFRHIGEKISVFYEFGDQDEKRGYLLTVQKNNVFAKKTNREWLEQLNDKDLADFINSCLSDDYKCTTLNFCNDKKCDGNCSKNLIEWLQKNNEK